MWLYPACRWRTLEFPCIQQIIWITLIILLSDGIAWDWLNKKLYWSDSEHREIEVLDPNSGDRMQLVETGLNTIPRDVAVDPNTRYASLYALSLYFTLVCLTDINSTSTTMKLKPITECIHVTDARWRGLLCVCVNGFDPFWVLV